MAIDKAVDSSQLDFGLTSLANAIRAKAGTNGQLSFPDGMAQAITDLPSGGGCGIEKTLLGTVTSPSGNVAATDLVTIDCGDLDFDTLIFARADGSGFGNVAFYDFRDYAGISSMYGFRYSTLEKRPMGFTQPQWFYVQGGMDWEDFEDYDNHIITIGYNRVSGGYNAGFSEVFNIYACKIADGLLGV